METKEGIVKKITPKQQRFCEEYMIDLNGTQAAIRAGYSKKTANEQASQLLAKLNIQSVIQELQKKLSDKTGISAEKVLKEFEKIGFSNIQDFLESGNDIADISQLDRDKAANVESITTRETIVFAGKGTVTTKRVSLKLHNKISALESLGKHLGLFEKDNQQKNIVLVPPTLNINGGDPKKRT